MTSIQNQSIFAPYQTKTDFQKQNIDDDGATRIVDALRVNTNLTALDLRFNRIGSQLKNDLNERLETNKANRRQRLASLFFLLFDRLNAGKQLDFIP